MLEENLFGIEGTFTAFEKESAAFEVVGNPAGAALDGVESGRRPDGSPWTFHPVATLSPRGGRKKCFTTGSSV